MKFKTFAERLEKIEKISSRLGMMESISDLFKSLSKASDEEISAAIYMLQGRVAPRFVDLETNISDKTISKILDERFGASEVNKVMEELGDLGDVYLRLGSRPSSPQKPQKDKSITEVYSLLLSIAGDSGSGSQGRRGGVIKEALNGLDVLSGKYFIRVLLGNLRIGFSDKTIIEAISFVIAGDKSLRAEIERAYGLHPDFAQILVALKRDGRSAVDGLSTTPGVPVLVKLVQREAGFGSILGRILPAIVQPKLDGLRCQIHVKNAEEAGKEEGVWHRSAPSANAPQASLFTDEEIRPKPNRVKLFSRNLEDLTHMFPELVNHFSNIVGLKSAIFDSEVIARDPKTGRFFPFQETMKRKRKYEIDEAALDFPIEVQIFDILYLNGTDLSDDKLSSRLETLGNLSEKIENKFVKIIESVSVESEEKMEELFDRYIGDGMEGLIAKDPDSKYKVGTRNYDWIKLKASSNAELADTVDTVVMGYYRGRGRQARFGIGAFLVGVLDKTSDKVVTVAKVGTGVTDVQWDEISDRLAEIEVDKMPSSFKKVEKTLVPDVWVKPEVICVVEADEISKSPNHSSGYAMRFPRLKEFDRKDKSLEDITSMEEFVGLHKISGRIDFG